MLISSKAIDRNGIFVTYRSFGASSYNVNTGINSPVTVEYTLKAFPKHIKTSQYNYPSLIGKDVVMFYILSGTISPKINDEISVGQKTYKVSDYQEHWANGELILYRVVAAR